MPRYAAWLERTLKERGHHVDLIKPEPFLARLTRNPFLSKYLGYLDKFLLFPPRLRRMAKKYDLVHVADQANSMYLNVVRNRPRLITCHDLLAIRSARGEFPNWPTGWSGKLLQRWILSGLRSAPHVLCVSRKTEDDLKKLIGRDGPKMRMIYNALNWNFRSGATLSEGLISRLGIRSSQPYLLHVGGNLWYKNRIGALRIFARLAETNEYSVVRLIMAGEPFTDEMWNVIREEKLDDRVVEATFVTNEELRELYSNALALLFPSLEEGFGWPILEAQACGCPVTTTNRPPMSEVGGDAAIYIDPAAPKAAAAAITAGLKYSGELRGAGFRNLKRFDEKEIVDNYLSFYETTLADTPEISGIIVGQQS
ncbi:MAG: glycosyltransferase family 1 protein [Terracidiphilus sp.]